MAAEESVQKTASQLLASQGYTLRSCEVLQSLWAGYGHICELKASRSNNEQGDEANSSSFILKHIQPPASSSNKLDEGNLRKLISYQVEQYFYGHLASQMPEQIAVAKCLASSSGAQGTAMILTNLRQAFPVAGEKRGELTERQVHAALDWLASFHGFWWSRRSTFDRSKLRRPPLEEAQRDTAALTSESEGVWLNGGYTYLATRKKEYDSLLRDGSEWSLTLGPKRGQSTSLATRVAELLAPSATDEDSSISEYETLIHGDVKSENLFTTTAGDAVAFFDFQYTGLGLGVCDLAKFFTCSVPEDLLVENGTSIRGKAELAMSIGEQRFLEMYQHKIQSVSGMGYPWPKLTAHWELALVDWLRFQASWGFWGNTEWLEARVRWIVNHSLQDLNGV